ncbi:SDR family oxidoreductase [Euzebya sp.]|uniref:SDR family oxidoreductase n=1 Tax=Euzebya sp. TaxID=1971409 RepID=UPI0035134B3B
MGAGLTGRRVLVTGGSSGIGAATARACAAAGARVAVLARRADRLEALADAHDLVPVTADVTDPGQAAEGVARATTALGGLDVLVNAAGVMHPGLITDQDPAEWRAMVDVNVLGLLAVTQAAIPHLEASDGGATIVNVSSMSGRRVPSPTGAVYSATKFAVHAIGEALRQELQPAGVRVTTISPGFVATELFDELDQSDVVARYRRMAATVGISPEDVAAAIVHALSAPDSVTTVEIAMVPTDQDDSAYASSVSGSGSGAGSGTGDAG